MSRRLFVALVVAIAALGIADAMLPEATAGMNAAKNIALVVGVAGILIVRRGAILRSGALS